MRAILVADLFCGAGGSSTGARHAIERDLDRAMELVCVNHWDRAIETHSRMHPDARHYCMDVASARPIECVPEGRLDLLMASPTCTYHSRARGGRPTSDQQRMDPWHVVTWLTELRVERVLIENVPEYVDWGPVDPRSGRPIKRLRGTYHREWTATLDRLGFEYHWRILNCADYGDATTRRRYFGIGRQRHQRKTVQIKWPAPTHTKEPGHDLLAPLQRWRPARECIDWSLKGRSIFGRKVPLAPRTMQRIYAGALRFGWPRPYLVILRQHMEARSIDLPVPTIAANGTHIGLAEPVLISTRQHTGGPAPRTTDSPLPTVTATDSRFAVAEPFMLGQHGERRERSVDAPVRTITGIDRQAIVEPFVLSQASGGAPRSVEQPFPTITTGGQQGRGEGTALITPYYGSGSGKNCKPVDEPLDTITTLDRFGLVCPVTHAGGGNRARSTQDPLPTLTTSKGGHLAFVAPTTHHDGSDRARDVTNPLPTITGARRGELAFITASFGERTHDLDLPMPTIPAQGSIRVAAAAHEGGVEFEGQRYDILFRMLHWRELARAMSFSDAEQEYEFAGTKTEITKQIGNAIPVRTARALVRAALWDLAA